MESECLTGYMGPLCQTCDTTGETKYVKKDAYTCLECKKFDEAFPELFFLTILIFAFFLWII